MDCLKIQFGWQLVFRVRQERTFWMDGCIFLHDQVGLDGHLVCVAGFKVNKNVFGVGPDRRCYSRTLGLAHRSFFCSEHIVRNANQNANQSGVPSLLTANEHIAIRLGKRFQAKAVCTRKITNCGTKVADALARNIFQQVNVVPMHRLCGCICNYCAHNMVTS